MLIICPKCFTKYEVDAEQFNEETHIFQCSNCGKRFEERVHFDDEKKENQQTIPPAFITEQPILTPLSESDYISSNRSAMDFTPPNNVVLPEEFTPVNDTASGQGRKGILIILLLCVLVVVGGSVYFWMNKNALLSTHPNVQKALKLVTTPATPVKNAVSDKDISGVVGVPQMPAPEEVVLTPIELDVSKDVNKVEHEADERILPVEMPPVVLSAPSQTAQQKQTLNETVKPTVENVPLAPQIPQPQPIATKSEAVGSVQAINTPPQIVQLENKDQTNTADVAKQKTVEEEVIILEEIVVPKPIVQIEQQKQIHGGENVQIRDVSFKYDQSDTGLRLFVQGVVSNVTHQTVNMPPLVVRLFDSNGTLLGIRDLPYGNTQMPPQSDEFFFYELTDIPTGTVSKIEIVVKG